MQCYKTLAAVTLVANEIDKIPAVQHKLPYCVIADWMAENDIEPEDVLLVSGDAVRAVIQELIERDSPEIARAA